MISCETKMLRRENFNRLAVELKVENSLIDLFLLVASVSCSSSISSC